VTIKKIFLFDHIVAKRSVLVYQLPVKHKGRKTKLTSLSSYTRILLLALK
jgi:hypothetical protein